jgi:hypothetical protein
MRDSDTYLAIIDEGREEEVKKLIRLVGEKRFGAAEESVLTQINAITDLERLERIVVRLHEVAIWPELLNTP